MASPNPFQRLLDTKGYIVLDGALATDLEQRGFDLGTDPLWSCRALLQSPDLIRQIHQDYYEAGADVAITASYQASFDGLQQHRNMRLQEAEEVMKTSVRLAQQARDSIISSPQREASDMLVAGSVGPYGAYLADGSEYTGSYGSSMSAADLQNFHRPRIAALVGAGVDVLACETIPCLIEIEALSELLMNEFPGSWAWFSCTVKDEHHLSDGSMLAKVVEVLHNNPRVVAVGVNCIPRDLTVDATRTLRAATSLPIIVYPNSGQVWDAEQKQWSNLESDANANGWAEHVKQWSEAGASIIGGCCTTGPDDIQAIASALASLKRGSKELV